MKQACKYNMIRFEPYAETQEFANIGIVLYAPKSRTFLFKILPATTHGRITTFFNTMNKTLFQESTKLVRDELTRIQKMLSTFDKPDMLYEELVRPREGIIHYSKHYVRFTDDPEITINELFEYYVNHSFTKAPGHEERMQANITALLQKHNLTERFKDKHIGNSHYQVRLPFVSEQQMPTVIKPIHFQHAHSKKLMDHGLYWLTTMKQLFRMEVATPDLTLFTYKPPVNQNGKLRDAFEDIYGQIKEAGITMTDIKQPEDIAEFAQQHTNR